MTKQKNHFIQAVRGICIIAVILIHCINGKQFGMNSFEWWYGIIQRQMINFPVGVFLFLAGYFTKYEKGTFYYKKRFTRLLILYIVWSVIYVLIDVVFMGGTVHVLTIIRRIIFGKTAVQMYFVLVLLQMTLIAPILLKLYSKNSKWHYIFMAITPIHFTLVLLYRFYFQADMPFRTTIFPAWLIFFWLGMYIRLSGKKVIFKRKVMPVVSTFILACVGGVLLGSTMTYDLAVSQISYTSCLFTVAIINFILHQKDKIKVQNTNALSKIGDVSYGIYYFHYIGILITNFFIKTYTFCNIIPMPVVQVMQLLVCLGVSMASIKLIKKIMGETLANSILGF